MMKTDSSNVESAVQIQLQYIAQSYIESHALHPKRTFQNPHSSHLSMVMKVKGRLQLTNPWFNIEDCLESL